MSALARGTEVDEAVSGRGQSVDHRGEGGDGARAVVTAVVESDDEGLTACGRQDAGGDHGWLGALVVGRVDVGEDLAEVQGRGRAHDGGVRVEVWGSKAGGCDSDGRGDCGAGSGQFGPDTGRRQGGQVGMVPGVVLDRIAVGLHTGEQIAVAADGAADDEERGGDPVVLVAEPIGHDNAPSNHDATVLLVNLLFG